MNLAMAEVATYVRAKRLDDCDPMQIEKAVEAKVDLGRYGLGDVRFSVLDFAVVRTFRIIQGQKWSQGEALSTSESGPTYG